MPLLTTYSKLVSVTPCLKEGSKRLEVLSDGNEPNSNQVIKRGQKFYLKTSISRLIRFETLRWVTATRFPLNDFRSFNSPFEVLFNFPSGYLFAIDLSPVFSHGWRLPPCLRSTPKERDSVDQYRTRSALIKDRAITFCGMPFQAP